MNGLWHDVVPLALALGAIRFTAFAVPFAFLAATVIRATRIKKWSRDVLVWVFLALAVFSAVVSFSIYLETRRVCAEASSAAPPGTTLEELFERQRLQAQCNG